MSVLLVELRHLHREDVRSLVASNSAKQCKERLPRQLRAWTRAAADASPSQGLRRRAFALACERCSCSSARSHARSGCAQLARSSSPTHECSRAQPVLEQALDHLVAQHGGHLDVHTQGLSSSMTSKPPITSHSAITARSTALASTLRILGRRVEPRKLGS